MATLAMPTQGIELQIGDGGDPTETFTKVIEVTDFTGPGGEATVISATNFDSVAQEKLMGLPDEGQFTFNGNFVPTDATHQQLITDRAAQTLRNFKLVLTDDKVTTAPTPTEAEFSAYILGHSISGGIDDKVNMQVTLEITGAVAWTYGVPT